MPGYKKEDTKDPPHTVSSQGTWEEGGLGRQNE